MKKTLPQLSTHDIDSLIKCKQTIDKDLSARHTVAGLASIAGMSITKFKAAFKIYVGSNVFEYAQAQRMDQAYELVTQNYHSIKTIAKLCGYMHASHFNTAFKKKFGISAKKLQSQIPVNTARIKND